MLRALFERVRQQLSVNNDVNVGMFRKVNNGRPILSSGGATKSFRQSRPQLLFGRSLEPWRINEHMEIGATVVTTNPPANRSLARFALEKSDTEDLGGMARCHAKRLREIGGERGFDLGLNLW